MHRIHVLTIFGRNLQDERRATQITPKHVETTAQVTNFGAKDISSNIGLGAVGSHEMHHIHIGTDPDSFSKGRFSGGYYKQKHDKDKIKGIVITPTPTHEFGLSPGKDGFELGYSEEQPILRTEY
ncbi:hypothetical protein DY000_02023470 [Brassica cretica]|uniref:Uncharacterized protein n=1 Tax=Brassica cretica TaxID=69181 RepID=A0ABQ7EJF4_BRACR|nr:hypothetical protein DY000_02023470 [Brassica cretica]